MRTLFKSNLFYFFLLAAVTCILIYITNRDILTFDFYKRSGELTPGMADDEVALYFRLQKWIYVACLFLLLVKVGLIALILNAGLYLSETKVSFARLFRVALLSEYIFLIPAAFKIVYFLHQYPDGNIDDWNQLNPLSLLSLVSVPADWRYLFQTLNVFEVAYWFLLAFGIHRATALNFDRSLRIVTYTYLPALFVWIASITFCSLLYFPFAG